MHASTLDFGGTRSRFARIAIDSREAAIRFAGSLEDGIEVVVGASAAAIEKPFRITPSAILAGALMAASAIGIFIMALWGTTTLAPPAWTGTFQGEPVPLWLGLIGLLVTAMIWACTIAISYFAALTILNRSVNGYPFGSQASVKHAAGYVLAVGDIGVHVVRHAEEPRLIHFDAIGDIRQDQSKDGTFLVLIIDRAGRDIAEMNGLDQKDLERFVLAIQSHTQLNH